ncbi:MAG: FixH family protein [Proteobacteria bacterium]|nr:FixH family protein [Pseudomonadota bacterium]
MQSTLAPPWYREPWPWILMAGPAAVVVAGAITIWIAVAGADGLVAEDYYKQGLAVNRVLALEKAAAARGIAAQVDPSGTPWRLVLTGEHAAPSALFVNFAHATRSGHDQRVRFVRVAAGVYAGDPPPALPGRWRVSIEDPQRSWRLAATWPGSKDAFSIGTQH